MTRLIQLSIAVLFAFGALAKAPINYIEKGNACMANKNFTMAIDIFEQALEDQEILGNEVKRKFVTKQLAIAHVKLKNYLKGELYLEQLMVAGSQDPEVIFTYAQTQQIHQRYTKAASLYKSWGELTGKVEDANGYMAFCQKLVKRVNNSSIHITPIQANSAVYADYSPFVHPDGYLVFTSNRPQSPSSQVEVAGEYGTGLFTAQNIDRSQASEVKKVSGLNYGIYNQGVASYTFSGNTVYFTANIQKVQKSFSNEETQYTLGIYTSRFDGFKWSQPEIVDLFSDQVNTAYPAISNDGKTMFFSSDINTGNGGYDLYVANKTAGSWGTPRNLGPGVNTAGNEVFPMQQQMMDGDMLYFSTDGRPGYGGLDIFECKIVKDSFETPREIKSPINSSYDDFGMYMSSGKGFGYFSSNREGTDDIYYFSSLTEEVTIEDVTIEDVETKDDVDSQEIIQLDLDDINIPKTPQDNVFIPSIEDGTSDSIKPKYFETDKMSGYYVVFCSIKNFKRLDNYRDTNYPDAMIIKGKEGFYKLCYPLAEERYEAKKMYTEEAKKYAESWIYKAGTRFIK
jgi:tetratricopeptide (TPR) repeat protein